jgi:hypothetical protein
VAATTVPLITMKSSSTSKKEKTSLFFSKWRRTSPLFFHTRIPSTPQGVEGGVGGHTLGGRGGVVVSASTGKEERLESLTLSSREEEDGMEGVQVGGGHTLVQLSGVGGICSRAPPPDIKTMRTVESPCQWTEGGHIQCVERPPPFGIGRDDKKTGFTVWNWE